MLLYHGSYTTIQTPNIVYSRGRLDFGTGFYLTNLKYEKPNWQMCIRNQEILDKYLKYQGSEEVMNGSK